MNYHKTYGNMLISSVAEYLETLAPLSSQEDYDNCGLLIGNASDPLKKALLCLDVTKDVLKEAIARGCNLVISHHPFIFKGLKKLTVKQPETEIVRLAILNDIAIYSIHTNLDNTLQGLNAHLLKKFNARKFRLLSPKEGTLVKLATFCPAGHADKVRTAMFDAGAGHIGNYDYCSFNVPGDGTFRASALANPFVGERNELHVEKEVKIEVIFPSWRQAEVVKKLLAAHPYEEVAYDLYPLLNASSAVGSGLVGELEIPVPEADFLLQVKSLLGLPVIRHSEFNSKPVSKIGICTGSGSFLIRNAMLAGVDIFLTADLKYHDFFDLSGKLVVADIGHYESEQGVKEWLHDVLIEKFPTFAFLISELNTNPIHYL